MSYWGWKPYVPVAERRKRAEAAASKAKKTGAILSPIAGSRGAIAKTFWGKAWCDNLERYSDYANRLPRGRTYVRNGSVIDLVIGAGEVRAQVMGSSLYRVEVRVASVGAKHWKAVGADCAGSIDSMVELLQGTFSKAVMQRLCRPGDGLFPAPKDIEFTCSCPDWAAMCKHVAAVLYGVGARLDQRPDLLFDLRRVDGKDLLAQAGAGLTRPGKTLTKARMLKESALGEVFGIEMAGAVAPAKSVKRAVRQAKKGKAAASATAATILARGGAQRPAASKVNVNSDAQDKAAVRAPVKAKTPSRVRRAKAGQDDSAQASASDRKSSASRAAASVNQKSRRKARN
jgi:uncharacterized Zn finger protein